MEMLTSKEWELLEMIDDAILSKDYKDWDSFVKSITEEEAVAIIKWVNRNTNKYYFIGAWELSIGNALNEYVLNNIFEIISDFSIEDLEKVWNFVSRL